MNLQQQILDCIWSKGLKKYIAEHGFSFTHGELVSIAYHFAPTYDERLRLLQLLADHSPEVSEFAARCISFQRACLERFCRQAENEVYELRIKEDPDAYEERYLCATFQTALDMIDGFYREYDCASEKETVCYVIVKRKILLPSDPFREDALQECELGFGKVLRSAEIWGEENDPKPELEEVTYPRFLPHLAAVRYRNYDNSLHHGVYLASDEPREESCYIIPLEGTMLKSREYDQHLGNHWHMHIPGPNVEAVAVDTLPEDEKADYLAFVEYWNRRKEQI